MRRTLFAPDHSDVIASIDFVIIVLQSKNRSQEALNLLYELLELRCNAATVDPDLIDKSLSDIAETLDTLNRPEEALIYHKQTSGHVQPQSSRSAYLLF
mmetsp:Transcript_33811/g.58061  ORF Transcript_33811/g.58061 Transcript_33811/m.58061 type:complete len:99 (-) Transcript_33811:10-306(-)